MTDNKMVHGYCIEYSHQGAAPSLVECDVYTTTTDGLFTGQALRIHTFGVTFFYDRVPAIKGLLERLEDSKEGHLTALAYIQSQIETARAFLKIEEEKQAGSDALGGAKPRC